MLLVIILQAYHDTCSALDRTEVFGDEMLGLQDDIETIKSYDEFFQLQRVLDHTADTHCTGMNVKVRKTRNKDQVPREKP